jgi:hypothetical protein
MNIQRERIIRILLFIIFGFVILRYILDINLTDVEQIKIILSMTLCLMFVNTYYPHVIIKEISKNKKIDN